MKIIISPSKTQNRNLKIDFPKNKVLFSDKTNLLYEKIIKMNEEELSKSLKIKGKLLESTINAYKKFEQNNEKSAIEIYSGLVFKNIDVPSYNLNEFKYLNNHLTILSAFYGILTPFNKISPYRLDMKSKIKNVNLYEFWKKDINEYFLNEELIINLASTEFSKILDRKILKGIILDIEFKEETDSNKYRVVAANAKKLRGAMVDFLVKNKIKNIEDLKEFNYIDYYFNEDLSTNIKYIFIKSIREGV